jgi:flagellar hook-length control protein FliK
MEISPMKTPSLPITTGSGETAGEAGADAMDSGAAADFQEMLQVLMRGAPPDDPAAIGITPPGTNAAAGQAEEEPAATTPDMGILLAGTAPAPALVPAAAVAAGMHAMTTPVNSVIASGENPATGGPSAMAGATANPRSVRTTDENIGAGNDRFAANADAIANPSSVPVLSTQQAEAASGNLDGGTTALSLPLAAPVPNGTDHAAVSPAPHTRLETAIGTAGWGNEFAQKVMWIAGAKQQSAELHLNPPDLGPLSISLAIDDDQASAVFHSAHSEVREAIQAALPRLREVLAESGIALGNASVTADSPREGSAFERRQQPHSYPNGNVAGATAEDQAVARPRGNGSGLVNLFA